MTEPKYGFALGEMEVTSTGPGCSSLNAFLNARDKPLTTYTDAETIEILQDRLKRQIDINNTLTMQLEAALSLTRVFDSALGPRWFPIETAPRDNQRPLILACFNESGLLQDIDFNATWEMDQESWEIPQTYYYWCSDNAHVEEPTHWMYQPSWFNAVVPPIGEKGE